MSDLLELQLVCQATVAVAGVVYAPEVIRVLIDGVFLARLNQPPHDQIHPFSSFGRGTCWRRCR